MILWLETHHEWLLILIGFWIAVPLWRMASGRHKEKHKRRQTGVDQGENWRFVANHGSDNVDKSNGRSGDDNHGLAPVAAVIDKGQQGDGQVAVMELPIDSQGGDGVEDAIDSVVETVVEAAGDLIDGIFKK